MKIFHLLQLDVMIDAEYFSIMITLFNLIILNFITKIIF